MTYKGKNIEIRVKHTFSNGHTDILKSLLIYGPPKKLLVTCSNDKSIRLWGDYEKNGGCLSTVRFHTEITNTIKWDEGIIICTRTKSGNIFSMDIFANDPSSTVKDFDNCSAVMVRKLNDDLFIGMSSKNVVHLYSFSKRRSVREYDGYFSSVFVPSTNSRNFFTHHWGRNESYKLDSLVLYDFVEGRETTKFVLPEDLKEKNVRIKEVFRNKKSDDEGIVCYSGLMRSMFVFNSTSERELQISHRFELARIGKDFMYHPGLTSFKYFPEGFVICSGHRGAIRIFGLNEDCRSMESLYGPKTHNITEWIMRIHVLERKGSTVLFAATHFDGILRILEVKNLPISTVKSFDAVVARDLEERIGYMLGLDMELDHQRVLKIIFDGGLPLRIPKFLM